MKPLLLLALIAGSSWVSPGLSITTEDFYNYGQAAGDKLLEPYDETSSPEIKLRTSITFYGERYNSLFVNSNGFISFLTEIPNFFNIQFPLEYPIIAAFYSDVDVTEAGSIWYRETSDPTSIARASSDVRKYFRNGATFQPAEVFIVTWDQVPPFQQRKDMRNTFQVVVISDGSESYILFHYIEGGIQWIQGDGKNPNLPDARAQAGLISGDGRMHTLKGSGTDQVRRLPQWSNVGKDGIWMFRVGQLTATDNVAQPDLVSSEELDSDDSSSTCASHGSECHSHATCQDYSPGFCCQCAEGYFGNGLNCLKLDEPLRVTGKVTGTINGIDFSDADLHSYVLTAEGRSYTAISRVPNSVGSDLQALVSIGTGIAWVFAKPVQDVKNGFMLSGSVLNRTSKIEFPQSGHQVTVEQTFQGLDVFNNVLVDTSVVGTLPNIPIGSKIEVDSFKEAYTRVQPGEMRARSNRVYRLQGQIGVDTPYSVETCLFFDECSWKPTENQHQTLRLKVSNSIFIQYDAPEQIVRYAMSAKMAPLDEADPCVEGRKQCSANSQCVVEGDTFRCICERGYEEVFDPSTQRGICLDMNECDTGRDNCDSDAVCINSPGDYSCQCKPGHTGDGYYCTSLDECSLLECDTNANCEVYSGVPQCVCRPGFTGDGTTCYFGFGGGEPESGGSRSQSDCFAYSDVCDPNADCIYDDNIRNFQCVCQDGYQGDGLFCQSANIDTSEPEQPYQPETSYDNQGYGNQGQSSYDDNQPQNPYDNQGYGNQGQSSYDDNQPQNPYDNQGYGNQGQSSYDDNQPQTPYDNQGYGNQGQSSYDDNQHQSSYDNQGYGNQGQSSYYDNQPQPPYDNQGYGNQGQSSYNTNQPQTPYDNQGYGNQGHSSYNDNDGVYPSISNNDLFNYDYNYEDPYQPLGPVYPDEYQPLPPLQLPEPEETVRPYQPIVDNPPSEELFPEEDDTVEPECLLGRCWCPGGYEYNGQTGKCHKEIQITHSDLSGGPRPYCSAAKCTCPQGYQYVESSYTCEVARNVSCNEVNNCHPAAQCIYVSHFFTGGYYECQCNAGYEGDGYFCQEEEVSCDTVNICAIHATCVYDDQSLRSQCVCNPGYQGDGLVCTPMDECSSVQECDVNAQCLYDSSSYRYKCQCNSGYNGDGRTCNPDRDATCDIVNNCDANADCNYDSYALQYRCQCRSGFEGDGTYCTQTERGCNVLYNCGENAECVYNYEASGYRCTCAEGFQGDGFFCQSSQSCAENPSVCHPQATCERDSLSQFGYSCRCHSGYTGDGHTCQEAPNHEKDVLLINQGLSVLRMPADRRLGRGFPIHVEPFMTAVGADVDCLAGRYYWTDVSSSTIRASKYDGREKEPVVSGGGIGSPEDVAVDWVSGNVYWTDSTNDVVSVAIIGGEHRLKVIKDGLVNPRGIAVHPGKGLLFWSDWNRVGPKIEASGLDGSGRRTLVDTNIQLPNSLVVDYETDTLCWADAGTHKIECIGVHGQAGRRVVMDGALYPFGLTSLRQEFFYTDWNDTKIHTVNKYTGVEVASRDPPLGGSGKLYGIAAVPEECPAVSNVCAIQRGNCPSSHICLPNGRGGRTCACPEDKEDCTDIKH